MRVAGITSEGDWIFGRNKASYKTKSKAISQNVVTRLRSFKNDWFLDVEAGIDWVDILSSKGNTGEIKIAVEKSVLQTVGVKSISKLEIEEDRKNRAISIIINYNDVFDVEMYEEIKILP